jgi:hypothetical protein
VGEVAHTDSPARRRATWQDGPVAGRVDPLDQVRSLCLDLPDVNERTSHGAPTFFIRDKTTFVMFHDDHHGDGRLALWCAAPPGVQAELLETESDRFFRPPYVGHRGWIGVRLDRDLSWHEVSQVIRDAYLTVAPKRLAALVVTGEET